MVGVGLEFQCSFQMLMRHCQVAGIDHRDTVIVVLLRRLQIHNRLCETPVTHSDVQFGVMSHRTIGTAHGFGELFAGVGKFRGVKKANGLLESFHLGLSQAARFSGSRRGSGICRTAARRAVKLHWRVRFGFSVFLATAIFFFKGILRQFASDLEYASRPQIGCQNASVWRRARHANRYDGLMKHILCGILLAASACAATFSGGAALDDAIEQAIREDRIPGAVLLVGHDGQILYRKAYGNRALIPSPEPMTADTIFDCASLTKVVATTSALMKLLEEGKVRLNDRVTRYLPEFQDGKSEITVRNLMTHFSGLRPDLDLEPEWSGYETGIHRALQGQACRPSGRAISFTATSITSCWAKWCAGSAEDAAGFCIDRRFSSRWGCATRCFSLRDRCVPHRAHGDAGEEPHGLRGVVHDPTARNMGGVAGHAGLFSTADDLGRFCQMLLTKAPGKASGFSARSLLKNSPLPKAPPTSPFCAVSDGTSIRHTRASAVIYSLSARTGTPDSRELRYGWIPSPTPT